MWKIIAVLLFTFITVSNALGSNSSLVENKALHEGGPEFVGENELKYVVSLGVFKVKNYIHVCLAVMVTGLNGITAGKCGQYKYYAAKAGFIKYKENPAEEDRTKLHVNTKRPMHFDPDTFYTVMRFIDFAEYLSNQSEGRNYHKRPDIGVFVLKKKVQYTRPVLNIPISKIKELPEGTLFTLIGINTLDETPPAGKMLMKKRISRVDQDEFTGPFLPMKPHHLCTIGTFNSDYEYFTMRDFGAPVFFGGQYVGIFVNIDWHAIFTIDALLQYKWHATVAIDAELEEHIDKIIAATWIPRINKRQTGERAKASISNATAIRMSI